MFKALVKIMADFKDQRGRRDFGKDLNMAAGPTFSEASMDQGWM